MLRDLQSASVRHRGERSRGIRGCPTQADLARIAVLQPAGASLEGILDGIEQVTPGWVVFRLRTNTTGLAVATGSGAHENAPGPTA